MFCFLSLSKQLKWSEGNSFIKQVFLFYIIVELQNSEFHIFMIVQYKITGLAKQIPFNYLLTVVAQKASFGH